LNYNFEFKEYNPNVKFQIEHIDEKLFGRGGTLHINGKKVETPVLWLGHVMGGSPHPWKEFKMDSLIVNAYDILRNKKALEAICEKGIHNYLDFKGSVLMDSGGFLFQKKNEIDVDPSLISDLYERSSPDLGVILDHPFNPAESDSNNRYRWENTLKNTKIMLSRNGKTALMPVLHGYDLGELKKACEDIKKISNPQIIGIGSLVPLLFRTPGTKRFKNPINYVIDAIRLVRTEFPNSFLHAFGVGSTKTMHLMYALGVDSIDSSGWRIKAAYGIIQLPGVSDRHVKSRNNGRRFLNKEEIKVLEKCQCPVCRNLTIEERVECLDEEFKARALHNSWVFVNEQNNFKKMVKEHNSEQLVSNRLDNGKFSKAYSYMLEKKIEVKGY
jgi:tRNA-guanine family transglycosylase